VLFRPEDVAVKDAPDALEWPLLGKAVVEENAFFGSLERLRLRLPDVTRVRMIDPPPVFGEEGIVVEASRSQHQARRYPLANGDAAWVGLRRIHALPHPGLRLLAIAGAGRRRRVGRRPRRRLAERADARLTVLVAEDAQRSPGVETRRLVGHARRGGVAGSRARPVDLVIVAPDADNAPRSSRGRCARASITCSSCATARPARARAAVRGRRRAGEGGHPVRGPAAAPHRARGDGDDGRLRRSSSTRRRRTGRALRRRRAKTLATSGIKTHTVLRHGERGDASRTR
jgi:hypothetical protein